MDIFDEEQNQQNYNQESVVKGLLERYEDSSQHLGSSKKLIQASKRKLSRKEMDDIFKDRSKYYSSLSVIEPPTSIQQVVVHVTPTMARDMLQFSRRGAINTQNSNRRIKQRSVKQYTELMNNGLWCLNGEAIIIDENGEVLDGHTRLAAAEKSHYGFITVLIWGIMDKKAFANTNVGDNRSRQHVLEMAGVSVDAKALSQVAMLAKAFENTSNPYNFRATQGTAFRPADILEYVEQHEELALSVDFVSSLIKTHKHQSQASEATYAFAHYLIKQKLKDAAPEELSITPELYLTNVISGLGQTSTDNIEYQVRKSLQSMVGESSSYALICRLSCIFKGWNCHMKIPVVGKRINVRRVAKYYKDEDGNRHPMKAAGNIKEAFTIPFTKPGITPQKIQKMAAMKQSKAVNYT